MAARQSKHMGLCEYFSLPKVSKKLIYPLSTRYFDFFELPERKIQLQDFGTRLARGGRIARLTTDACGEEHRCHQLNYLLPQTPALVITERFSRSKWLQTTPKLQKN